MIVREIMDEFIEWLKSLPGDEDRKMIAYDYVIGFLHDVEEDRVQSLPTKVKNNEF